MTHSRDGQVLKEFRAVCPFSRFMAARVFSRATAGNARRFLLAMIKAMPFAVASIQVDGGSEFMADFERACEALRIPLKVLPPRRPQWNGHVERASRSSARIEFWNLHRGPLTVAHVAPKLPGYGFFHNNSATAHGTGLPHAERAPCRDRACCLIRQAKIPKGCEPPQCIARAVYY